MPTYEVTLNVNVPGLGNRAVLQTVIVPSIDQAAAAAVAAVIITATQVRQTAP